MIPSINNILASGIEIETMPSKDYHLVTQEQAIRGKVDDLETMRQVVYKILNTERYQYVIYSFDYGVEFQDLIGEPVTYVCPEVKRRIQEALLQDDRITAVDSFKFDTSRKHEVVCAFEAHTIFGEIMTEKVVSI